MENLLNDIRVGLRAMRARPWYTASIVGTLAVAIGISTSIFSAVDAVLLRPLPVRAPEQLVRVWGLHPKIGRESASLPDYTDWKAQSSTFSGMTAFIDSRLNLSMGGGEPERVDYARVLDGFFDVLGVQPALGRGFLPGDFVFGSHRVAVLSDALWRDRFGADPRVFDRPVSIDGATYQIIGVAPAGFAFPERARLWTPLAFNPANPLPGRRGDFLDVVGRLKPGVTMEAAAADLRVVATRLEKEYPATNATWSVDVQSLQESIVGSSKTALLVFLAAVGLVLLVTCANVANLLLARAAARDREMSIRATLGATRRRLFRQTMTESVLLAAAGGALGILLATWGVRILPQLAPADMPRIGEIALNGNVLAFAVVVSLGTGVLFGILPALRLSQGALSASIQEGGRTAGGRRSNAVRGALVAAQVALAAVNLLGGGLLLQSFLRLQRVETGVEGARVLTFQLPAPREKYREARRAVDVFARVAERIGALPNVERVGLTSDLPVSGSSGYGGFQIVGAPPPDPSVVQDAQPVVVDSGYLRAIGLPLLEGRGFTAQDREGAPRVALVSRAFVTRHMRGASPLGARITFGDPADTSTHYTIVGVVGDTRLESLSADPYPMVYRVLAQVPMRQIFVAVRTKLSENDAVLGAIRKEIGSIDPDIPLTDIATIDQRVSRSLAQPRVAVVLIGIFAAIALALAISGLYAVIAYTITQRTREIGIRMALGATGGEVMRLVIRQGMITALIGVAAGLALALIATQALATMLFGIGARDPLTFVAAPLILLSVALAACAIPARTAASLDPVSALREP
jgi:putative ABC transport system permease protein